MGEQPATLVPEKLAAGWALADMPTNSNAPKHTDFSIKDFKQDVAFISLPMMNKKLPAVFYTYNKIGMQQGKSMSADKA